MSSNHGIKALMIHDFGNVCWLNGTISRNNPLTYHHCVIPKRNGGKATEENGALLTHQRHEWFNELEREYPELAKEVNIYMSLYKGEYPEQVEWRINQIFALVNPEHKGRVKRRRH
jgi:hypothetical protein